MFAEAIIAGILSVLITIIIKNLSCIVSTEEWIHPACIVSTEEWMYNIFVVFIAGFLVHITHTLVKIVTRRWNKIKNNDTL